MPTNAIPAYACIQKVNGGSFLTTTYKPYFDAHRRVDDGESNVLYPNVRPFSAIRDGLDKTGIAFEMMESVFELDASPKTSTDALRTSLAAAAAETGIELIFGNAEFDNACAGEN